MTDPKEPREIRFDDIEEPGTSLLHLNGPNSFSSLDVTVSDEVQKTIAAVLVRQLREAGKL